MKDLLEEDPEDGPKADKPLNPQQKHALKKKEKKDRMKLENKSNPVQSQGSEFFKKLKFETEVYKIFLPELMNLKN